MIVNDFYTCPTSFLHQESELSYAHAQQKMTTPSRRARDEQWLTYRGGKS